MSGALFVSNPRRKNAARTKTKAKKAKKSSVADRIIARLNRSTRTMKMNRKRRKNGLALRANGLAVRMNRKRRKNGLALRANGLALRANRKRKTTRRRKNTREIALRFNGRRRRSRRVRRNGLAVRMNRKHSMKMNRRHKRRRNAGAKGGSGIFAMITKPISNLVGKFPVVGKVLGAAVLPLAVGAAVGAVHLYALRYAGQYIPQAVRPFGYTLGGLAVKALLSVVPVGSASDRKAIGDAAVVVGGAMDVMRFIKGESQDFADGGMYQIGAYGEGGYRLPFDGDEQTIQTAYVDAKPGDAAMSSDDLDDAEIEAALGGPRAWMSRFPFARRTMNVHGTCSRHAGQPGHRWGWLHRLVGCQNVAKIAAMPIEKRRAYLRSLRAQAIAMIPRHTESVMVVKGGAHPVAPIVMQSAPTLALSMQSAPSMELSGSYGAALYAGGPF
jgi:hypothetical protein